MTSSSEQPPKERKKQLLYLEKSAPEEFQNAELMDWIYLVGDISTQYELDFVRQFGHAMKSRPHPAPAFKRCCDSCINVPCKVLNRVPCLAQEKQENICEENGCTDVENCDEICQHSRLFSPLQMQEAKDEAARKAREDVLDDIIKWKRKNCFWIRVDTITGQKRYHFDPDRFEEFIESLRSTTPHAEQEQPR